jgi:hypothetical protein
LVDDLSVVLDADLKKIGQQLRRDWSEKVHQLKNQVFQSKGKGTNASNASE